jgi:hypothetical protein
VQPHLPLPVQSEDDDTSCMSERTPLLSGGLQPQHPRPNGGPNRPSIPTTPWTLHSAATALVVHTRHSLSLTSFDSSTPPSPSGLPDSGASLAVHLYALYLVSSVDARSSGGGIRSQLFLATVNSRIRDALCDAIEEVLDGEQRAVEEEEMSVDETALDRTEQGEVERMLWRLWDVDGSGKMACGESRRRPRSWTRHVTARMARMGTTWLSVDLAAATGSGRSVRVRVRVRVRAIRAEGAVVDLLLPGFTKRSSPFLSHPLVRHALHTAWYRGVHLDTATATGPGVATVHLSTIRRAITPA